MTTDDIIRLHRRHKKGDTAVKVVEDFPGHYRYYIYKLAGKLTSAYYTPKMMERLIKRGKIRDIET